MTEEQLKVQQQTGIPDERFDPSFWQGRGEGSRPPDKIIWQTWTAEEKAASGYPDFAAWQKAAQAWRGRFQEGGDIWKKHRKQEAAILQAAPQTEQQLRELLNSLGLFDLPDAGRARFRQLIGAFRGTNDLSGRFHYDPETGQIADMGTSDTTIRGVGRGATQAERDSLINRSFLDQIADSLGVSRFRENLRSGQTFIEGRDPATGYLFNRRPSGETDYFDDFGFRVDPATGQRYGYAGGGNEALMALLNEAGGAEPGYLRLGGQAPSGASGGGVSPGTSVASPNFGPLQGLADLLGGFSAAAQGIASDKPFFQTFEPGDPLSGLFPDLRTSGFQNILGGIQDPQIRAFKSGGFQVGTNLADLFPQTPAFKFGAPMKVPQMSTDFIAPPPMPTLPEPPPVPTPPPAKVGQAPPHRPERPLVR